MGALNGLSLVTGGGEYLCIVGPSGSGKSTLLRIIAGLEDVEKGSIQIDGTDVTHLPPGKRQVAMVFQSYALYPHMSVYDNIAFGLRLAGLSRDAVKAKILTVTRRLEIVDLLARRPDQLSGGQKQRVALARALSREPKIFLLDEPLSNSTPGLRDSMKLELKALHKSLASTILHVTHDQSEAMALADRVAVMRDGNIEQIDPPHKIYAHPVNKFVATFIGTPKINIIPAFYLGLTSSYEVGIRPERVTIMNDTTMEGHLNGQIEYREPLGADDILYIRIDAKLIMVARTAPNSNFKPDDKVRLFFLKKHFIFLIAVAIPKLKLLRIVLLIGILL